jgi:hypothetical protein
MNMRIDFVRQSLALHLFFGRIMKEHSFFLQLSFMPRDAGYTQQADAFRLSYDGLLREAVSLSNGVVNPEVLQSGEVVTPYTINAEMLTTFYTGIQIPTDLTQAETELMSGNGTVVNPALEHRVAQLNQRAIDLTGSLIQFKAAVLSNVLSCKMFTVNYPLLIEHIMREARLYVRMLQRLQNREIADLQREALEQEAFWNRIMAEHSKFIRGLLDPTENELFITANNFGNEFDQLTAEALAAMEMTIPPDKVTEDSLRATLRIREFKAQGTLGLLECKIRSIIIPLLGDHVLREANRYLRLLKMFSRINT